MSLSTMPRLLLVVVSKPTTGSNFKVKTYCANYCRSVALIRESQIPLKQHRSLCLWWMTGVTFGCSPSTSNHGIRYTQAVSTYSVLKFAEHPKAHPFGPNLSFQWFCSRVHGMEEASSIQCLYARPSRWNAGRKNFQPVTWPGSGSEKPHVWVILTVLRG